MVSFVGAGPGAVDLISVRGMNLLKNADVIIYAGSLVNRELLSYAKKDCDIYNSATMTLDEVMDVIISSARELKEVVRLHTGEPSIYGAVREQMDVLDKEGIAYESCPGISACFGAAASLNLEYTLPGISQSLIITRMEGRTKVPELESIESFAKHKASMAIYLSTGMLDKLKDRLISGGYGPDTPAAIVYKASWPEEKKIVCTLSDIAKVARENDITKTALVLVGDVISHTNYDKSKLYAEDFSTEFREEKKDVSIFRKKRLVVVAFTERGMRLAKELSNIASIPYEMICYSAKENDVKAVIQEAFLDKYGIIFIGATGIAVRYIASYVDNKLSDSPVISMDEYGRNIIPLLSGHMGGANEISRHLAKCLDGKAIITTATDLNGCFSVDLFAKENRLTVTKKSDIAFISGKVLSGDTVNISVSEDKISKVVIDYIRNKYNQIEFIDWEDKEKADIIVSDEKYADKIWLKPKKYVLGIGCKKDTDVSVISDVVFDVLQKNNINMSDVYAVASIDVKMNEDGLIRFCSRNRLEFITYGAEDLNNVSGDFTSSDFVKNTVGVDNVCERAATKFIGEDGSLVVKKNSSNGVTVAIGEFEWMIS